MHVSGETTARLRLKLSELEPRLPAHMRILEFHVDGDETSGAVILRLLLQVTPAGEPAQRWAYELDFTEDAPLVLTTPDDEAALDSGALVIFANLAEWWETRNAEPPAPGLVVRRLG